MMMSLYGVFMLFTASLVGFGQCNDCNYLSLANALNLSSQSPDVRPVLNWRTPTIVKVNMVLFNVVNLDTRTQTLVTYLWFSLNWKNEFISWNPEDYCGIESFFASFDNIWQPDIFIPEMIEADDKNPVILYNSINHDGTIKSSKPLRIVSTCNLEIFLYPFDIQKCNLSFETYIEPNSSVQMIERFDSQEVYTYSKENFFSKGEWELLNHTVKRVEYGVTHTITLKRKPTVQVIAFIIPICFLVILDVAGMFINFTEGEGIMFKIVVVLGFSVLMVILTNILPTTDSPPLLCSFCFVCMTLMVVSLMGCITTSYLLSLSETSFQAPLWFTFCIKRYLARVLFFKIQNSKQDRISGTPDVIENGSIYLPHGLNNTIPICMNSVTEKQLLTMLLIEVQTIQQEVIAQESQEDDESDWQIIALVLDRLFTILYLLAIIITFIVTFSIWRAQ